MSEILTSTETGNQYFSSNLAKTSFVVATSSEKLHGRTKILVDDTVVTDTNVMQVLAKALRIHPKNRAEIEYLYNYRKGIQPILFRTNNIRPELTKRIVENRASQIVNFATGYICGSSQAIQYIASCKDGRTEQLAKEVSTLNEFMMDTDGFVLDKELFDWIFTCGVGYKMVLPDEYAYNKEDTPFKNYILDPRNTFVVYSNALGEPAIMGVNFVIREDGTYVYSCYTKEACYTIEQFQIKGKKNYQFALTDIEPHILDEIPIIEYIDNHERMGRFEAVITMLDAINNIESDRAEAIEQFVQAYLIVHNAQLSEDNLDDLKSKGCIMYEDVSPEKKGEISYISLNLDQNNTQTLSDSMYQSVLEICGMPSMSDGSTSDSSNNGAVIMKQGWGQAEARAKNSEEMFKLSERKFLKLVLRICQFNNGTLKRLHPSDIQIKFTRRNYEDIATKSQVLVTMLNNEKIDPKLAFEQCGMFTDTERAYLQSMEYYNSLHSQTVSNVEGNNNPNSTLGTDEGGMVNTMYGTITDTTEVGKKTNYLPKEKQTR